MANLRGIFCPKTTERIGFLWVADFDVVTLHGFTLYNGELRIGRVKGNMVPALVPTGFPAIAQWAGTRDHSVWCRDAFEPSEVS